ncbi:HAMP domain-containing protein [Scytonema sp. UIC 10036]|uniref:sensor histidine kinase n=1 Tax=Scytonema sp. UIC 10036 TaxID=2304196 RepID=UPI0012DA0320|nr:HAMP domain-containing sensor histidine kinase [Scytonema sp. UIC 10036]MUG92963.1 HAMP domain-containing protein [Scytonema sp. UIC 10036]
MTSTPQASHSNLAKRAFHRLSIRQKIVVGYAVALGIAILGTIAGLEIGNRYYQKARYQMIMADEEGGLLSELQGAFLEIQSHQQEIVPLLKQPQILQAENSKLLIHVTETEKLLERLQEFSQTNSQKDLHAFLEKHEMTVTEYFQQFKLLLQQLVSNGKLQEESEARSLIWQFYQNPAAIRFNEFIHELTKFTILVQEHQEQADVAQNQAATLQAQIIIGSILFSTALATVLALYTSRTIAHPIKAVTAVAKQVTKEANFDLQVPVITKDEVGELAISLNQLIQQVKKLLDEQQAETQARLIQSEKMISLGKMLAGVAHEIINPVNFISGNLVHAKNYTDDILTLLKTYKTEIPNPPISVQLLAEEIDLEFLEVDLQKLLSSIEFGADRTREIAISLKDFSRLDEGEIQFVDIHVCLNSTLVILQNRLKKGINIVRNYGDVPHIPGYPGLLYQVFMNLLSNAIDALEEKTKDNPHFLPEITITTELGDLNLVFVRIGDNGSGISLENQSKIFETFFTTKPRGIGTGLGLAITYQIVVEKHGGKITCKSELDKGTEFTVFLPMNSK